MYGKSWITFIWVLFRKSPLIKGLTDNYDFCFSTYVLSHIMTNSLFQIHLLQVPWDKLITLYFQIHFLSHLVMKLLSFCISLNALFSFQNSSYIYFHYNPKGSFSFKTTWPLLFEHSHFLWCSKKKSLCLNDYNS